jgi:hypothetical protein
MKAVFAFDPSFPRKRESISASDRLGVPMDSRFRGNDEKAA